MRKDGPGSPRHPRLDWDRTIAGAALLLAFALRLYHLAAQSLWEDEIFTVTQVVLPFQQLIHWTAGDIHPPGYYVLLGLFARLGGWWLWVPSAQTDWLWRLPSVLLGTAAVALTFRLGRELMGREVAVAAALLLALSPVAVQYSQEARMHELFLFGAVLSTWVLNRALSRPEKWKWWLFYGLAAAFNLYVVYLGFAVLAAQAVWVLVFALRERSGQPVKGGLLAGGLAFVLYIPWWPVLLSTVGRGLQTQKPDMVLGSPLSFGLGMLESLGPAAGWSAWLFLVLCLVGILSAVRKRPDLAAFGVAWLLVPMIVALAFGDPRAQHMRNAFMLPVYLLFVGRGCVVAAGAAQRLLTGKRTETVSGSVSRVFLVALMALVVAASAVSLPAYYGRSKTAWRQVADYLNEKTKPGDVIVTGALFDMRRYLDYYYHGPAELVTPAMLVNTLPHRSKSMRAAGGRVWAVVRFSPQPMTATQQVPFPGLVILEPTLPVYEPDVLTQAMINLSQQEVAAAFDWAAQMQAQGLMEPDPLVTQAAAYLFLGDVYRAAGDLPAAVGAYEAMVADQPYTAGGYVTLAKAYQAAGQTEKAAHAFAQAVSLDPAWQGSAADQAAALLQAGRWQEAVAAYESITGSR